MTFAMKLNYYNFLIGRENTLSDEQKTIFMKRVRKIAKTYNTTPTIIKQVILKRENFEFDLSLIQYELNKMGLYNYYEGKG